MKRPVLLAISLLLTSALFAQSGDEFGRVSGGTLELLKKRPRPFSGSLSLSTSDSANLLFGDRRNRVGATLGGTLVADRVWFFASAERAFGYDGKLDAQLGDRQHLNASFASVSGSPSVVDPVLAAPVIPSTFLNLHYTAVISDHMFFSGSFSQRKEK